MVYVFAVEDTFASEDAVVHLTSVVSLPTDTAKGSMNKITVYGYSEEVVWHDVWNPLPEENIYSTLTRATSKGSSNQIVYHIPTSKKIRASEDITDAINNIASQTGKTIFCFDLTLKVYLEVIHVEQAMQSLRDEAINNLKLLCIKLFGSAEAHSVAGAINSINGKEDTSGLFLLLVALSNTRVDADFWFTSQRGLLDIENALKQHDSRFKGRVSSLVKDVDGSACASTFATIITEYTKSRPPKSPPEELPPPPEKTVIDFFEKRLTDPTLTTTELHELNAATLPDFKKHNAYKALLGLLRLSDLELDKLLSAEGCQRALLEALKGMGGDSDDAASMQCSILGLFLIAWSAIRERKMNDDRFLGQFTTYSKKYSVARKDVDKLYLATQGSNSLSAVLSAFFLFHELATDDVEFTNDQLVHVHLDERSFRIEFSLKQKGTDHLERFESFKENVEKAFSGMQANCERKASPVVELDRPPSTRIAGRLTSKALIHLMMEVGCRQSLFGGDKRAEMSVQWKDSEGILVIKFAPRMV